MAAIITNKFRIHNAEQFKEGFSEASSTNMYLFIGRPQSWDSDASPDTPLDTVEQEAFNWQDMVAMKRIQASDVSHAVIRRNWTAGKYYDIYRHNYDGSAGQGIDIDSGAPTTRATLFDANFFVVTDEYNVYTCLDNRNASGTVAPSTVKPTGESATAFTTSDGYKWKYMYSISASDVLKFVSTDFVPVKTIPSQAEAGQYDLQWAVQSAAVDGAIENIVVTNTGSGYTSVPDVAIAGDGTGATATAVVDESGALVGITIADAGSGYNYATVTVSGGGGTGGAAEVIISPRGGHGSDATEELGGFYVMMNIRLEYDDGSGDFPVDNDYRRIGIVKDPYNYGTTTVATASTLTATKSITFAAGMSGTFIVDEVINGATTGAQGRVVSWDSATRTLRYIQTRNEGNLSFATGENVAGLGSLAVGTVSSVGTPEVQPYSGDIIFYENRRPINRAADQLEDIKLVVEM